MTRSVVAAFRTSPLSIDAKCENLRLEFTPRFRDPCLGMIPGECNPASWVGEELLGTGGTPLSERYIPSDENSSLSTRA